jgi:hypothetical protein
MPPKEKKQNESLSLKQLAAKVQGLRDKLGHVENELRQLKDLLNYHDNWHSEIIGWVGKPVAVGTGSSSQPISYGVLHWADRYHYRVGDAIYPKGMFWIRLEA